MFDALCTYPLTSDLFAQSIHPTSPLFALGLASGHVQLNRLPSATGESGSGTENGTIETVWRTRRHKGSCRTLCFSPDGTRLFSAGTDGLVKVADAETGVVRSKIAVPLADSNPDPPTLLHPLTPQTLLLATDSSALHLFDLRAPNYSLSSKPQQTHHPHDDYISSITALPPSDATAGGNSKQFLTTGGSTVAVTDLRRGVLVKSEDQGEELLSSALVGGKVVVGGEKGVLRVWEVGVWDDNEETVVVGRGVSADVLAQVPEEVGEGIVAVGMDDGGIRFVRVNGRRRVLGEIKHDELEGVGAVGFESAGRMISGGGSVVKVWEKTFGGEEVEEEDEGEGEDVEGVEGVNRKRVNGFGSGEDSEEDEADSSEEEEKPKRKKKKKKGKKGKGGGGNGGQHVLGFKGMD